MTREEAIAWLKYQAGTFSFDAALGDSSAAADSEKCKTIASLLESDAEIERKAFETCEEIAQKCAAELGSAAVEIPDTFIEGCQCTAAAIRAAAPKGGKDE